MVFRFASFELDPHKFELRRDGEALSIEPQVFELLQLLVSQADRIVTKDEIIDVVWDGRFISDAALSSRIKSARQLLGDTGKTQAFIKTIHGRGFRFVAPVEAPEAAPRASIEVNDQTQLPVRDTAPEGRDLLRNNRPSIAVLPFTPVGDAGPHAGMARALAQEVITELARLRWLFVIARGSTFQLDASQTSPHQIGQQLGVRYCLTGSLDVYGPDLSLMLELTDTKTGLIIWAEQYNASLDDIHLIRRQIVASIIASLELQITAHEARKAQLNTSENLDAWSSYHLGLHHMFRFNADDNARATQLFKQATALDPHFARAYAGLSFTRFQDAFLNHTDDYDHAAQDARRFAEKSLELDALDPFCNFTMGRSFWLEYDLEQSLGWLERSTQLSPNYAQGIYATAWAESISGYGKSAQQHIDTAIELSPLDPLLYGMRGARAFAHMVSGEVSEAAQWAEHAATSPGAHVLIWLIAVAAHDMNGDTARAEQWAARVRQRTSAISQADYFKAFPFKPGEARDRMADALTRHGF